MHCNEDVPPPQGGRFRERPLIPRKGTLIRQRPSKTHTGRTAVAETLAGSFQTNRTDRPVRLAHHAGIKMAMDSKMAKGKMAKGRGVSR